MNEKKLQIGIDTGGTFTDFIVMESELPDIDRSGPQKIRVIKVPSTPKNPAKAMILGLRQIADEMDLTSPFRVVHGSTVATNTVLERKGPRMALLTTQGFGDLLYLARQDRPELYDLGSTRPPPLIEREYIFEVKERLNSGGSVQIPLMAEDLQTVCQKISRTGAQAVVICFLHAYTNPTHEIMAANALRQIFEKNIREQPLISMASQILPRFREYERLSTTVLNAYVQPAMHRYLCSLEEDLARLHAKGDLAVANLTMMRSDGGQFSLAQARERPLQTILSGPAGGVVGAQHLAANAGYAQIITLDMGGTSTDVSLIPRDILRTSDGQLAGLPFCAPMIDVHSVGAGGGSIVSIDAAGALRVGPQSAGADPGPLCYGNGKDLTVTDANLFLGRLDTHTFLGGKMILNTEVVEQRLREYATRLHVSPAELAEAIVESAELRAEQAIRLISVDRGFDPREFALFSYGGAGGLHAAHLARKLSMPQVIIPPNPGALSAFGMLVAPLTVNKSVTILRRALGLSHDFLRQRVEAMSETLLPVLLSQAGDTLTREQLKYKVIKRAFLEMRYVGESFEIEVPLGTQFVEDFHRLHQIRYGYSDAELPTEIVHLTCELTLPLPKPGIPSFQAPIGPSKPFTTKPAPTAKRKKFFYGGQMLEGVMHARNSLGEGFFCEGPALITEYSATTFLPPDCCLRVDTWGNMIIEMKDED